MAWLPKTPTQATDDGKIVLWRLLIAKQFYLHALEHSKLTTAIDKMIAIHNFHNAIEIFLKTIAVHYPSIKVPKHSTIPSLIDSIDQTLKPLGVVIPLSNQLLFLNDDRNLVQHQAHEPGESVSEQWRYFTLLFLRESYKLYFGVDFDTLSRLDLIDDPLIKDILSLSLRDLKEGYYRESLILSTIVLEAVLEYLVGDGMDLQRYAIAHFHNPSTDEIETIQDIVNQIAHYADRTERNLDLLSRGINLQAYQNYRMAIPRIDYDHKLQKQTAYFEKEPDRVSAQWALDFVVDTLVSIQPLVEISPESYFYEYIRTSMDSNCNEFIITIKSLNAIH